MKKSLLPLTLTALFMSSTVYATEGWYVGAGVGSTTVEEKDDFLDIDYDADDTAYKIYGGYRFNKNFALEAAYMDFGEPDDNIGNEKFEVDINGFSAFAVGILPVIDKFEVFGKIGVFFWDVELEGKRSGLKLADEDGYDMGFGFGAQYDFTDNFTVRGEFEAVDADTVDEVYVWSASAQWRF